MIHYVHQKQATQKAKNTMLTETYNAIMALQDQFISHRDTSRSIEIAIFADDKETIETVTTLARNAGCKVKKNVVGKGENNAEMHISIR